MSALCPKRTSGKVPQRYRKHSKAAGQVSNQRLCPRSQRAGLGWRRWVVEPATSLPFRSRGDASRPTEEKIDVAAGGFKADQLSTGRKKAVAFDRNQIVGLLPTPVLNKDHRVNWVERANVSASRAH
jgi:hypothetical protein